MLRCTVRSCYLFLRLFTELLLVPNPSCSREVCRRRFFRFERPTWGRLSRQPHWLVGLLIPQLPATSPIPARFVLLLRPPALGRTCCKQTGLFFSGLR